MLRTSSRNIRTINSSNDLLIMDFSDVVTSLEELTKLLSVASDHASSITGTKTELER